MLFFVIIYCSFVAVLKPCFMSKNQDIPILLLKSAKITGIKTTDIAKQINARRATVARYMTDPNSTVTNLSKIFNIFGLTILLPKHRITDEAAHNVSIVLSGMKDKSEANLIADALGMTDTHGIYIKEQR